MAVSGQESGIGVFLLGRFPPPTEEGRKRGRRWHLQVKPSDKAQQTDLA